MKRLKNIQNKKQKRWILNLMKALIMNISDIFIKQITVLIPGKRHINR